MSKRLHTAQGETRVSIMLRFAQWIVSNRQLPTPNQVRDRFDVSYPTACRWLAAARELRGGSNS